MEEEEQINENKKHHIENLSRLCRLCGNLVSDKGRKPKEAVLFSEALKSLRVEIEDDCSDIHPPFICERCRKICGKIVSAKNPYNPQVKPYNFKPHKEKDCYVCDQFDTGVKTGRGRKKQKKVVNQYNSDSRYNITKTEMPPNKISHPSEPTFDIDKVKQHAKSFVFIEADNMMSFTIFCKVNEPYLHMKPLVNVNIYHDLTWSVAIIDSDVSSNKHFKSIPKMLSTYSAISLIEICSNLNFCVGNEDMPTLCDLKKNSSGLANFYDRKSFLVAEEVKDLICENLSLTSTIRHKNCELITDGKENFRCSTCSGYRPTLISLRHKAKRKNPLAEKVVTVSSHVPNKFLSKEQLSQKLKMVQTERKSLIMKNKTLKERIDSQINEKGVNVNDDLHLTMKKCLTGEVTNFPEGSAMQLLYQQQIEHSKLKDARQMRWHPIMIRWALGLYHTSPAAYDFLRRSSFLKLPHRSTLLDYSVYTKPGSGFNPDVINRLYLEADVENLKPHERNVSLLYDELKIKSDLVYNKSTGQIVGFVELGDLNEELSQFERDCSDTKKERSVATHILAFMVRGIYTKLNFVFAYFPTTGASCDELFPCVWESVAVLASIGLTVKCFISDGASPNRSLYKLHKDEQSGLPYFAVNLCDMEQKIYFICDPPHLIKTIRNNWENSEGHRNTRKLFFDKHVISWKHLVKLWEFENDTKVPGLYMTKIRREHIDLTPASRMNVRLAAQSLSKRVADALKFQNSPETKGTERFVRTFDRFFDCLNVQYKDQALHTKKDALKVYTDPDDERFKWLEEDFLRDFINKWEGQALTTDLPDKKSQRKLCLAVQTLEGIRITVKSFVAMSKELLRDYPRYYLLSGKLNQDPLEQHFSAQRRRNGDNTNPTVLQYGYNELALHTIKSKNVASLKGNSRIKGDHQINFMTENEVPLKRRKFQN